ncbi:MAG TPA: hypothetical protein VFR86_05865, partial [Burkholderiaceae bacterium]|nr:hypothetical protein [Burkholderiaceae bacterium]
GTGRLAAAVRRRLPSPKARRSPKQTAATAKQVPPRISRQDLAALRSGRPSAALRKKLFSEAAPAARAAKAQRGASEPPQKQAPMQAPPGAARRPRQTR